MLSLRAEVLSEENYYYLIDSAVAELGAATLRNWNRWEQFFVEHEELALQPLKELITSDGEHLLVDNFSRMPQTYAQEVIRIKHLLREHDLYATQRVSRLEVKLGANIRGSEASYVSNAIMFLGFFAIFALIVHLGRRFAP